MQGPFREDLLTRISTRSSVKDLYRIMQGPLREEFSRISTRASLRENLQEKTPDPHFVRACAVEMHMDIWQDSVMWELKKCRGPSSHKNRGACASLCSRNGHGHVTGAILRENLQEKGREAERVPWSDPSLNSYRKNPPVWTHCLRNQMLLYN